MGHRYVEHTAELELELDGATAEDVLRAAVDAARELVAPDVVAEGRERVEHPIEVGAADRPALLAAWVEELLFLAETRGLVPLAAHDLRLEGETATARIEGVTGEPRPYVKAVTYHRLELARVNDGWRGRVVLDV